jgi:hypothetical protein
VPGTKASAAEARDQIAEDHPPCRRRGVRPQGLPRLPDRRRAGPQAGVAYGLVPLLPEQGGAAPAVFEAAGWLQSCIRDAAEANAPWSRRRAHRPGRLEAYCTTSVVRWCSSSPEPQRRRPTVGPRSPRCWGSYPMFERARTRGELRAGLSRRSARRCFRSVEMSLTGFVMGLPDPWSRGCLCRAEQPTLFLTARGPPPRTRGRRGSGPSRIEDGRRGASGTATRQGHRHCRAHRRARHPRAVPRSPLHPVGDRRGGPAGVRGRRGGGAHPRARARRRPHLVGGHLRGDQARGAGALADHRQLLHRRLQHGSGRRGGEDRAAELRGEDAAGMAPSPWGR